MSVEALLGTDRVFAADLVALRPQPGQAASASNLRALLAGSADRREPSARRPARPGRLLAALRAPGVRARRATRSSTLRARGAGRARGRRSTTRWCCPTAASSRAATSTGRRWAFACDFLAIAAAEVGAIAERRTDRLLDAARSHGLPPFLAASPGVDSGTDDRPVHAGRAGRREPPAGRAGERRFASDQRDAGGPRVDGVGGGAQAAVRRWRTWRGSSRSS